MRLLPIVLFLLPILGVAKPAGRKKTGCAGTIRLIAENEHCPPPNETVTQRMDDLRLNNTIKLPRGNVVQTRIFGGEDAKVGEFESQVQFIAYNGVTKQGDVCGGVVISEWAFATNAHCVYRYVKSVPVEMHLLIYHGSIFFAAGQQHNVHKILLHPEFEHFPDGLFENDDDLAVVAVLEPFPVSAIAVLPTKPKKHGINCLFSGFGSTNRQQRFSLAHADVLQKLSVTILPKFVEGIDNSFYGGIEGPTVGDSGNALLCPEGTRNVVTGLQTAIATDVEGEELPVFLDLFYFRIWLNEQIAAIELLKHPKDL